MLDNITYDEAISFIYEHRQPKESYGDTLRRMKSPLAQHLYDAPDAQQLATALEQYNKVHHTHDPAFETMLEALKKGELTLPRAVYDVIKNRLPTIRYAFTNPLTMQVRVRLMEETKQK